jgi:alpha-N-arabinofuranosidase
MHGGQSIPMADAIATVDASGKTWSIALVNRHPGKSVACTIKMKDAPLDGRYPATILSGDAPEAFNDIEHPDRVVPEKTELSFERGLVNLRPHSLTIIQVPAR